MRSSRFTVFAFGLLATVAITASGCGAFGSGDDPPPAADETPTPPPPGPNGELPRAPAVGGPPDPSELTNTLGVFVAPSGADNADGTRERPLARIQPAIDLAKTLGKRVYVCAGTYREALVLADSISIIGGLDCGGGEWRTSLGFSRVEAPSSPAVRATDIKSPTRLDGLEVVAPNATAPSGSSIGLIAERAGGIAFARSKITAGNAMKGDDGVEGIQLSNAPTGTTRGAAIPGATQCVAGSACKLDMFGAYWVMPAGGAGGTNTCVGASGFVAEAGGVGGSGGLREVSSIPNGGNPIAVWRDYTNQPSYAPKPAPLGRTGAPGADGADRPAAPATGTLSRDGYIPADGANGTNGATGFGGSGGDGLPPHALIFSATLQNQEAVYRGWGGGGGGAGGCPGLAGTAGKGGGASIAAMLIESPITFDGTQLTAGQGGNPGHGSLGSIPTVGGLRSNPEIPGQNFQLTAALGDDGGRGGAAGVSSNGGSGPSLGIAHVGTAPKLSGGSTSTPGTGGAAIAVQSRTALGITKIVPATPAGVSKDVLAF